MAYGGGTFIAQNKILPGSYINFVSAGKTSATLSERGIAAMPLELSWGPWGDVFTVTADEFLTGSSKFFGYDASAFEMRGMRELFANARMCHFYRLGDEGTKAQNTYATAKHPGTRGNLITVVVSQNVDNQTLFDVKTLFDGKQADIQKGIADISELSDNDFVVWKKSSGTVLATAGTPMTGGVDGEIRNGDYEGFLKKIENYAFHTLGVISDNPVICRLFTAFTKRMRESVGVKFQTVLFKHSEADYEGVISLENECIVGLNDVSDGKLELLYWLIGAQAGCNVNKTLTGMIYNGELNLNTDMTQQGLEDALENGKFVFHRVGDSIRVLSDINTLKTFTPEKTQDFGDNQVMRVLDQIGNDIAILFNKKYLGKMPNDNAGRISFKNDIAAHHDQLQALRAIENFDSGNVVVDKGSSKKSVVVTDCVTPVCAMTQLYMTVVVE